MAIEKNNDKMKALDAVLLQIEKQYGKGSIMRLGDEAGQIDIDVIPTGCLTLDLALGIGGLPRGRIIEIYGPESSGKTTVALHVIAEAQKLGGVDTLLIGDVIEQHYTAANYNMTASLSFVLMLILILGLAIVNHYTDSDEGGGGMLI